MIKDMVTTKFYPNPSSYGPWHRSHRRDRGRGLRDAYLVLYLHSSFPLIQPLLLARIWTEARTATAPPHRFHMVSMDISREKKIGLIYPYFKILILVEESRL
jgi:hypothetical protein